MKKPLERIFQSALIKEIKERFPGCMVFKTDPNYIQGVPDLIILHGSNWASLECKRGSSERLRPNQAYYVEKMNEMSFSRIIHPDNKEEVLNELYKTFKS